MERDYPLMNKNRRKIDMRYRRSSLKNQHRDFNINNRAKALYTNNANDVMDDSPKSVLFKENPFYYRKKKQNIEKIKKNKRRRDALEQSYWHESVIGMNEETNIELENQCDEQIEKEKEKEKIIQPKVVNNDEETNNHDDATWCHLMYCTPEQLTEYEFALFNSISNLKNKIYNDKMILQEMKNRYYQLYLAKKAQKVLNGNN